MTRILRNEFANTFQSGIDISELSDETRAALADAGVSKDELKKIAHDDGKISGNELKNLFDAIDKFDNKKLDGSIETLGELKSNTFGPPAPTKAGIVFDSLTAELDRNRTTAQISGPQASTSNHFLGNQMEAKHFPRKTQELFEKTLNETDATQRQSFLDNVKAALAADDPKAAVKTAVMQQRIDNHFANSAQTYKLPDGTEAKSRSHFRIADGLSGLAISEYGATSSEVKSHITKLIHDHNKQDPSKPIKIDGEMKRAITDASLGRATPEQLHKVTQALIDAGELQKTKDRHPKPPLSDEDALRMMQFDHGVGLDCGGYTQQAFLDAHGISRSQAGLNPKSTSENMQHLSGNNRFTKIKEPEKSEPGDVFVLDKDDEHAGHVVIVRERHAATATDKANWTNPNSFAAAGDNIQVFEVDSSYGAGTTGDLNGGVQRRVWLFNETTNRWAETTADSTGKLIIEPQPEGQVYAGHPFKGIYRLKD